MTVTARVLIPAKIAEASQSTQYTATNYSTSAVTISVNLVTAGDTAGSQNLIVKTKTLQPSETYTFPEIVGQILNPNGFISTLASAAFSINIRASGREVS